MDLDEILLEIGEFGRYQKLILWLILLPSVFPCGFHAYNQLFMAAKPDHWCRVPELKNLTTDLAKNLSIPQEEKDGIQHFSQCSMFNQNYSTDNLVSYTNKTISCQNGWIYDKSVYKNSVITEWDLVCEKGLAPTLALVIFGIAGLIGNYIFGYVQDGLGRKSAFYIYLFIQTVFGFATAFANNFYIWLLFRFGVAIELVGPKYRVTVTILLNIAYSLSLITLSIIVWAVRDWRMLAVVTTSPFLLIFCCYCIMPESPRWLLSQKKYEKAYKILRVMARVNKKTSKLTVSNLKKAIEDENAEITNQKQFGVLDLFRSPKLRLKTIIITFIWFTNTSVYVGLSYYAPGLGGDEFLNFFLAGAAELPTYLFLWPAMERCGRRSILCVTMIVGGFACLATFMTKSHSTITLVLYCIGKMGISSAFVVLPLIASEIYPTVVRGIGISISSVAGMLGPVFIPLINHLGAHALTLPLMIMGVLSIAGGICSMLLPETLNRRLPQTLEDGEKEGLVRFSCGFSRASNSNIEKIEEK
ncbi:hypothetical protein RN001_009189 [Aquatica leii]|uniref:Organic cation transporter 1 n=1 Tax=Aquatica leii TaxID=1421715 RepID=A0AAN7P6A5_9COLE|nr:hypothetical protein RN001_009189 [Aquatica leii]